jgi:hypothetical protein
MIAVLSSAPVPLNASDVSVSAFISPSTVAVGDQATLTVKVEGKFRKSAKPQLPSLDEFYVYESGSSQSFSIVNGSMSSSLQFTYTIVPRKTGAFTVEPIRFQVGDKVYTADPVTIEVVASSQQVPGVEESGEEEADESSLAKENIFVRGTVDRDTVYVNQQVTWTLGFYTDGRRNLVRSPNFTPPPAEGFWVEDLTPQKKYYKTISGRNFLVNEIKRAFFPTAPGLYTIGAARVEIVVDDFGRDAFDDFFNLRRNMGFGKPVSLATREVPIVVLPLPLKGKPDGFSGIIGQDMKLTAITDKQVAEVGEPINLTLEIGGRGNVKTMSVPEIPAPEGFKMYESGSASSVSRQDYAVSGSKTYEYVLVPQREAKTSIPPIRISYFDPEARRYAWMQSPAVMLDIKPGSREEGRRIIFAGSGEDIEVLSQDINYIHPVPAAIEVAGSRIYKNGVFVSLQVVPLLAVLLALTMERRQKRLRDNAPSLRAGRAAREAEKKLHKASSLQKRGKQTAAFPVIATALDGYMADKMNVAVAGLTPHGIEEFLRGRNVGEDDLARLRAVKRLCDEARYAPTSVRPEATEDVVSRAFELVRLFEKRYF